MFKPCIGNNPHCPCQDGDLCHYEDEYIDGVLITPAFKLPEDEHAQRHQPEA